MLQAVLDLRQGAGACHHLPRKWEKNSISFFLGFVLFWHICFIKGRGEREGGHAAKGLGRCGKD